MQADAQIELVQVEAVILHCGCGNPQSHAGAVCPKAIADDRGVVAKHERKPTLGARIKQALGA